MLVVSPSPKKPKDPPPEGRVWVRCPACRQWRDVDASSAKNNSRRYKKHGVHCRDCGRKIGRRPCGRGTTESEKLANLPGRDTNLPDSPTEARPGTEEKQQVMAQRYAAGRHIYHPQDLNCLPEGLFMDWLSAIVEVNRQVAQRNGNGHSSHSQEPEISDAED